MKDELADMEDKVDELEQDLAGAQAEVTRLEATSSDMLEALEGIAAKAGMVTKAESVGHALLALRIIAKDARAAIAKVKE